MIYVWDNPRGLPDRYYASIDYENSPSPFDFGRGFKLSENFGTFNYTIEIDKEKLERTPVLVHSTLRVVSPEIRRILEAHAKDYVQFISVAIKTRDGVCLDYSAVNVLPLVENEHVDEMESYFEDGTRWNRNAEKKELSHAVYKEGCLGENPIGTSKNEFADILVSESLYLNLSKFHNTGLVAQEEAARFFIKYESGARIIVNGSEWK
jgi:hypothetical protein